MNRWSWASREAPLLRAGPYLERDTAHIRPTDAGPRVEIDAQFVGMLQIARADRMRVQFDAAEVDYPRESGRVIDDDLLRGSARRERQGDGSQPGRPLGRRSLLIKGLCPRPR